MIPDGINPPDHVQMEENATERLHRHSAMTALSPYCLHLVHQLKTRTILTGITSYSTKRGYFTSTFPSGLLRSEYSKVPHLIGVP